MPARLIFVKNGPDGACNSRKAGKRSMGTGQVMESVCDTKGSGLAASESGDGIIAKIRIT